MGLCVCDAVRVTVREKTAAGIIKEKSGEVTGELVKNRAENTAEKRNVLVGSGDGDKNIHIIF